MAEHETIADIIAEMREIAVEKYRLSSENGGAYGNPGVYYLDFAQFVHVIADRIEAAHRREVATTKESLAVGNSGDCAKLREALETLRELLGDLLRLGDAEYHDDFSNFCDIIDAALAAPPRNCERFQTVKQAKKAYCAEVRRVFVWDGCETERLVDWLLAPATEKEGGNDGNE